LWEFLQLSGAAASIVGLVGLLPGTSADARLGLVSLAVLGVVVLIGASILSRPRGIERIGRAQVAATACSLILHAKDEVILFGGDMSWASDYEDAILSATTHGKRVVVIYPRSKNAPRVNENIRILKRAGAMVRGTAIDTGFRAILVDRDDAHDALLFMIYRRLRRGATAVSTGEPSSDDRYEHAAKLYGMKHDWTLIQAVTTIYEVLQ
jgi:hypothetical protein